MATAKKAAPKKTAAKKEAAPATGTAMMEWNEELAKYAAAAAATEANTGTGLKSFSLKAGVLSYDDAPLPGNQMAVVILDHVLENTFYAEAYDPENPTPPDAYALGRDEKTMRWSDDSIAEFNGEKIAGELCDDTHINQFGSADKGRGKAARNLRRLLLIPAGSFDKKSGEFTLIEDADHYAGADMAFMKIPPTSITGMSLYVKQLAGAMKKPPFAVVTLIKVAPDAKSQFKVTFELLEELPLELMETVVRRHKEAAELIMQPYNMEREEAPAPRRGAASKTAAKKTTAKKGRKY